MRDEKKKLRGSRSVGVLGVKMEFLTRGKDRHIITVHVVTIGVVKFCSHGILDGHPCLAHSLGTLRCLLPRKVRQHREISIGLLSLPSLIKHLPERPHWHTSPAAMDQQY